MNRLKFGGHFMNELKPCPFCGGKARIYASELGIRVMCTGCCCQTGTYTDFDHFFWEDANNKDALEIIVERWNRRVKNECTDCV